jgi:hypothetical protein
VSPGRSLCLPAPLCTLACILKPVRPTRPEPLPPLAHCPLAHASCAARPRMRCAGRRVRRERQGAVDLRRAAQRVTQCASAARAPAVTPTGVLADTRGYARRRERLLPRGRALRRRCVVTYRPHVTLPQLGRAPRTECRSLLARVKAARRSPQYAAGIAPSRCGTDGTVGGRATRGAESAQGRRRGDARMHSLRRCRRAVRLRRWPHLRQRVARLGGYARRLARSLAMNLGGRDECTACEPECRVCYAGGYQRLRTLGWILGTEASLLT